MQADPIDVVAKDCENVTGQSGSGGGGGGTKGGESGGPAGKSFAVRIRRAKLRAALAKGLRLQVDSPAAGTLRATATAKGRTVARATRKSGAGRQTVTLKFTTAAKRKLRGARSVKHSRSPSGSAAARPRARP